MMKNFLTTFFLFFLATDALAVYCNPTEFGNATELQEKAMDRTQRISYDLEKTCSWNISEIADGQLCRTFQYKQKQLSKIKRSRRVLKNIGTRAEEKYYALSQDCDPVNAKNAHQYYKEIHDFNTHFKSEHDEKYNKCLENINHNVDLYCRD